MLPMMLSWELTTMLAKGWRGKLTRAPINNATGGASTSESPSWAGKPAACQLVTHCGAHRRYTLDLVAIWMRGAGEPHKLTAEQYGY